MQTCQVFGKHSALEKISIKPQIWWIHYCTGAHSLITGLIINRREVNEKSEKANVKDDASFKISSVQLTQTRQIALSEKNIFLKF